MQMQQRNVRDTQTRTVLLIASRYLSVGMPFNHKLSEKLSEQDINCNSRAGLFAYIYIYIANVSCLPVLAEAPVPDWRVQA